jgi:hypothetical protein
LYKEGCFILEAKQGSEAGATKLGTAKRGTAMWAAAMQAAQGQAVGYAQTFDNPPPFLIVCDIGYCFDLYATFDGSRNYRDFPSAQHKRIFLRDLGAHVEALRTIFLTPHALDPSKRTTKVTREIAGHLAELARDLEGQNYAPADIATFLMRCIFTMFAEDAGLLPDRAFTTLLEKEWIPNPNRFADEVTQLWQKMNTGGALIGVGKILHFNGGLFADQKALPLTSKQLELLHEAARSSWVDVEPAIFGTLLEGALDPKERHALGAHFTPRGYVERLVRPTIEEPLRAEWDIVRAHVHQLLTAAKEGKTARKKAIAALHTFHRRLCAVSVLDPACGTGNFLYVTLDLLKRLESEVFQLLVELGETQAPLQVAGLTVTPAQFHGIEVKRWAKEIAELVLWIGYLQWLMRARGDAGHIPEPVLQKYGNIECRDAVLAWDAIEPVLDANEKPVTRWDGVSTKLNPVTGEQVPDDTNRVPVVRYVNARRAEWPDAEFIVGNPPFIGNKRMRGALGDGYVEALRAAHDDVPETADFVMYWWNHAAQLVRDGRAQRFGLITTKSITHVSNRGIVAKHLRGANAIHLAFAIPNHPWIDAHEGAAVRVAMTSGAAGMSDGRLLEPVAEDRGEDGATIVRFRQRRGVIQETLQIGPNSASLVSLRANSALSYMGVTLVGQGFLLNAEDELRSREPAAVKPYVTGGELNQRRRNRYVIDLYPHDESEARARFPEAFQRVLDRVRPERRQNARTVYREKWWLHAEPRPALRAAVADLDQFIAICRTAKHRVFQTLPAITLVESTVVAIALPDLYHLGVLSSRPHVAFSLLVGTRLGVGDDPRYNNSLCFDPFPFPIASTAQEARIRALARQLEGHRKMRQQAHPDLTITAMYNVLDKVRDGSTLTAKDRITHEQGLVSILRQLHDELDVAVIDAYGWPHDISDPEIVERLVALNAERAAEEESGAVRWLRPERQRPQDSAVPVQAELPSGRTIAGTTLKATTAKQRWPKPLPDRIGAVRTFAKASPHAVAIADIRSAFAGAPKKEVEAALDTLASLGLLLRYETERGTRWKSAAR